MKKTTHFLLGCMAAFGGCIQSGDRSDASLDVVRIVTDAAADDTPRATRDGQTYDPRCSARRPVVGFGSASGPDRCEGVTPPAQGTGSTWCSLGADVPGLMAPRGLCVRRYAEVPLARVMSLAPNGDLFVTSPSAVTAAGDSGGRAAIVVLSDDNQDGVAEVTTFASGQLDTVHGIVVADGYVYFTTIDSVQRTPYRPGQRTETPGAREFLVGDASRDPLGVQFQRGIRWTHGLARSVNGRLIATRGEYSSCGVSGDGRPSTGSGEIYEGGARSLTRMAAGFRNPMYARCHYCKDLCLAAELGEDQSTGAVETLVVLDGADRWHGYPCCYQRNAGPQSGNGLCNCIDEPAARINLGDTPFGFDWERGAWPEPYRNGLFVALHGSLYVAPFANAGVAFLPTDPATGVPRATTPTRFLEATNRNPVNPLQRPSDVVFARDGRMFVSDDRGGSVFWLAPLDWRR